jgi:cobyrinic acid a,c-diamide synthase
MIAGLKGGSGKTVITVALITALKQRGFTVASFKKGPDYIDSGWLSWITEKPCYNLDLFLFQKNDLFNSFSKRSQLADIAVIEGNRGLYDGVDIEGSNSAAELATLLNSPVIVVVDCSKATRTVAALIQGLQTFDPDVNLKGVILNHIVGKRHETIVKGSIEQYCRIPVVGVVPRLSEDVFPQRHLGLTPFQEHQAPEQAFKALCDIGAYLDLDKIVQIASSAQPLPLAPTNDKPTTQPDSHPLIGLFKDSAFQFYYPDNIESLIEAGATIRYINAFTDKEIPKIDALYIGGGFPETHALMLAENRSLRESLKEAVNNGLPVYAECGGLMFLGETLVMDNKIYPMCGALPISFLMEAKPQAHGYTVVEVIRDNPFFQLGDQFKGHEFHYSKVIDFRQEDTFFALNVKRGHGILEKKDGLCYKNVFAAYTHLHALSAQQWVNGMIKAATRYKDALI